jgi:hypothetical protein
MQAETSQPTNLIFWGAGATAALGMPTTQEQANFVRKLVGVGHPGKTLRQRVADALNGAATEPWHNALSELILILGDSDDALVRIDKITAEELDAMRPNWRTNLCDDELKRRIIGLRLIYDWPTLKSVVRICPACDDPRFRLNDLFNVLDMHIDSGVPAPAKAEGDEPSLASDKLFFEARRLIGARNALKLILIALFHITYQVCLSTKQHVLGKYRDFALQIGRRVQRQGVNLARDGRQLDGPEFYRADVGFVSLNYDPIALWIQFIANRQLNQSASIPHIGSPPTPLHLFHDFGHLIPARGVERRPGSFPWYPLNEAAAQRLNEEKYPSGYRVRLTKFLFPHGCLCWRECPNCGKLSAYHGHSWDLYTSGLFPPPPLRSFDRWPCPAAIPPKEQERRENGMVDARACLHCETMTYDYHTQVVMQSSFKPQLPSFLEEIQRELRATTMGANHIILMGYSLPVDDVTYRAFFSARRRQKDVRCTVVNLDVSNRNWFGPAALKDKHLLNCSVIKAARDIFGENNIRFYGGGIPQVFLDENGQATERKLEELLNWWSPVSA